MGNSESGCGTCGRQQGTEELTTIGPNGIASAPASSGDLTPGGSCEYTIWVLGGTGSTEGMNQLRSVEKLEIKAGIPDSNAVTWDTVHQMNMPRLGACAVHVAGHVYIVGGWNGSAHDPSMERIKLGEAVWESVPSMRAPRTFAGVTAVAGGALFVCGGMTTQKDQDLDVQWNTSTVERFDVNRNVWDGSTSMTTARLGPGVVTLTKDGKEYIVCLGGVDGEGTALRSCEQMDTHTKKWASLPDLPEARAAPGAGCWQGQVIVYGGCGIDGVPLDTGVILDVEGKAWNPLPSMQIARGGFGLTLAGNLLVAIGGSSKNSYHLKETEFLDLSTLASGSAHWVTGPAMQHERRYPGVAVSTSMLPV